MIQQQPSTRNFTNDSQGIAITLQVPSTLQQLLKIQDASMLTQNFVKKYKKQLSIYVFCFNIKYYNRQWQLRKRFIEFSQFASLMKKKYGREMPGLPIHKQNQLTSSNVGYFADFLLIFIRKVTQIGMQDEDARNFLEILPIKYGAGIIYTQICLEKHSGGRYNEATCGRKFKRIFCACCRNWRKRYFTVTDECVFYTQNKKSYQIKQMLAFSSHFNISYGINLTGDQLGITIKSAYRNLELRAQTLYEFVIFIWAIKTSLKKSSYCTVNRYGSYAAIRQSCFSKYYIDGQNYFSDLCDQLLKAKNNVYITGWMLTPYLLLKRPKQLDDRSCRLDYVLESIAQKGVRIYIIIYMEPKIALNNDSQFVQYYLEELHKNIRVLRHPNYILVPFLWSHHQKIVVIDQKCAFMGGLDLCYGRWDNQKHHLTNLNNLWKGADFCNFRTSDIYQPRNFLNSNLDPLVHGRMPWHDIAIQIRGDSVIDLSRHFVQYWNFVNFQTKFNDRQLLIQAGRQQSVVRKSSHFWKNPFSNSPNLEKTIQLKQGLINQQTQQKEYYQHFLQPGIKMPRISRLSLSRNLNEIKQYPKKLMNLIKTTEQQQYITMQKQERLMVFHLQQKLKSGEQSHQILRSASMWSLGLEEGYYQKSIYEAYQNLIMNAKEFIYIENQFFICKKNVICQLLAERILMAHKLNKKFKVIIMLPLLPGFEGQVQNDTSAVMRVQLHWQYQTIARSKNSLLSRLSTIPESQLCDYLQILSLRNHAMLEQTPITQILYIHSKLMIVDDAKVILGSANINDRSLLGDRDSEIGIIVQEDNFIQLKGLDRKVVKSAHLLRCQLFKQHFNITNEEATDYHNETVWKKIAQKAENNTKIYREVFGCYPDDTMKTYPQILNVKSNADLQKYPQLSKKIDGFVVQWPMYFLEKQDLYFKLNQKQFFVPEINFT